MAEPKLRRRGHGEDAIYFAASKDATWGRSRSASRRTASGSGGRSPARPSKRSGTNSRRCTRSWTPGSGRPTRYTVRRTVEDWLHEGLDGRSERTKTLYAGLLEPVLEIIGAKPLRDLTAGNVRLALGQLTSRYSTRSLQISRNALERAIQHAQADDLVARNVAALVKPPRGRSGRPSRSFTLEQAKALLAVTEGSRWHAYVALSLLAGIRTEEARALRWDHVVTWADDAAGWQPVTTAGFDHARAGSSISSFGACVSLAAFVPRRLLRETMAALGRPRRCGGFAFQLAKGGQELLDPFVLVLLADSRGRDRAGFDHQLEPGRTASAAP